MYGYIYVTTNKINGKIYVGKNKSSIFNPKYLGSGKLINRAIEKYGYENFETNLICECYSKEELNAKEKFYIQELDSLYTSGKGYNISTGGDGGPTILNTRMMNDGEHLKFVSVDEVDNYLKNGWKLGPTSRIKQNFNLSLKNRRSYSGENNPFYNKHHSENAKKLIGLASKGRCTGENNPAKRPDVRKKISENAKKPTNYFNTHKFRWITNGCIEKRVDVCCEIPKGFYLGRLPQCIVTDGQVERHIPLKDLDKYISKGFHRGKLKR